MNLFMKFFCAFLMAGILFCEDSLKAYSLFGEEEVDLAFLRHTNVYLGPIGSSMNLHIKKFEGRRNQFGLDQRQTLKGSLWGIAGGYDYLPPNWIYLGLNAEWTMGKISGPSTRRRWVHDAEVEDRIGFSFNFAIRCKHAFQITPYSGYGFSYIVHSNAGHEEEALKLKYRMSYVPLGLRVHYVFSDKYSVAVDVKWMPQVDSTVKIININGIRWELKNRSGGQVEIPMAVKFGCNNNWGVRLTPFLRKVEWGHSTNSKVCKFKLYIPEQREILWGAKLVAEYVF